MNAPADIRAVTNMTSKGQVLIPKDVREAIGLIPGRPVRVGLNDRGEAVVLPDVGTIQESRDDKVSRLMATLREIRKNYRTGRTTDEIMRELRGDEPLP